MATWSGKTKGGKAGYGFFLFILKYTHLKVAYFFLKFVAFYFLLFSNKKPIKYYFKEIIGLSGIKVPLAIYKNYCLLGQVLTDKISFLANFNKNFTFSFEGEEHLHQMAKNNKGGLLIGAHIGNWEIAGNLLERIDTPVNILMLDAEHKKIKDLLENVLKNRNVKIIPIKDDLSHQQKVVEAIENKEFVAMHGDRFLSNTGTVDIDFMGKPAPFPSGPLYIASKYQVPVSFVFTVKDSVTHYHFYATPGKTYPYPARLKTRKQEIKTMVGEYVNVLETKVKKYPFQWFNYHPFWREEIATE